MSTSLPARSRPRAAEPKHAATSTSGAVRSTSRMRANVSSGSVELMGEA